MASLSILAVRNRALAEHAPARPAERVYHHSEIFAETHWRSASAYRESCDVFACATRWHVIVVPRDHAPRDYYLVGSLSEVTARAKVFFPNPLTLVVTPAKAAGPEFIDRRCHTSLIGTKESSL